MLCGNCWLPACVTVCLQDSIRQPDQLLTDMTILSCGISMFLNGLLCGTCQLSTQCIASDIWCLQDSIRQPDQLLTDMTILLCGISVPAAASGGSSSSNNAAQPEQQQQQPAKPTRAPQKPAAPAVYAAPRPLVAQQQQQQQPPATSVQMGVYKGSISCDGAQMQVRWHADRICRTQVTCSWFFGAFHGHGDAVVCWSYCPYLAKQVPSAVMVRRCRQADMLT